MTENQKRFLSKPEATLQEISGPDPSFIVIPDPVPNKGQNQTFRPSQINTNCTNHSEVIHLDCSTV